MKIRAINVQRNVYLIIIGLDGLSFVNLILEGIQRDVVVISNHFTH